MSTRGENQSDGSIDNLMLIIVVMGDLQNEEMIGDNWSPTESMSNLKYFLDDDSKHKTRVHQLYFIGVFLRANNNKRVFVKLDSKYGDYFSEYCNYFGRPWILNKSMYGMTNSG